MCEGHILFDFIHNVFLLFIDNYIESSAAEFPTAIDYVYSWRKKSLQGSFDWNSCWPASRRLSEETDELLCDDCLSKCKSEEIPLLLFVKHGRFPLKLRKKDCSGLCCGSKFPLYFFKWKSLWNLSLSRGETFTILAWLPPISLANAGGRELKLLFYPQNAWKVLSKLGKRGEKRCFSLSVPPGKTFDFPMDDCPAVEGTAGSYNPISPKKSLFRSSEEMLRNLCLAVLHFNDLF